MYINNQVIRLSSPFWKFGNPLTSLKRCAFAKRCPRLAYTIAAHFHSSSSYKKMKEDDLGRLEGETLWDSFKRKMVWGESTKLLHGSYYLYEACTDSVDFLHFFKRFNLPDNFLTWFLIMELHVWMCIVRAMTENSASEDIVDHLVTAMWKDVEEKMAKLGYIPRSLKKESLRELYAHFRTALIAYDEGLLGEDKVLAAALWRNFFLMNCNIPEHLEMMVHYVRRQVAHLDQKSRQTLFHKGCPSWLPLQELDLRL